MCGFTGFVNIKEKLKEDSKIILEKMNYTLSKRGPDEDGYFISDNACLAHKRLIVIDPDGRKATNGRTFILWGLHHLS